ncbi:hypothetical protein [Flavobacterium sp. 3HN19-14]|uniref:hypothetical protein n=1 Tax=Flavobacterium sp. 3HN19-14 TaxID=3448133 RepID=UPI003EE157E9
MWTYHDLSNGREFPYWLPFAWGLAFAVLHDFEKYYIKELKIKRLENKILLTLLATAVLPTIGEIVAVNLGVWSYVGNYKILEIPLYAIGLLMLFHTTVFLLLCAINLRWKTSDLVFAINLKGFETETNPQ